VLKTKRLETFVWPGATSGARCVDRLFFGWRTALYTTASGFALQKFGPDPTSQYLPGRLKPAKTNSLFGFRVRLVMTGYAEGGLFQQQYQVVPGCSEKLLWKAAA
jgi:hypothetical protein